MIFSDSLQLTYLDLRLFRADSIVDDDLYAIVQSASMEYAARFSEGTPYIPTRSNLIVYARDKNENVVAFAA